MSPAAYSQLEELRDTLRQVVRGLWRRRRLPDDLVTLLGEAPSIGRRHVGLLAHVGRVGPSPVGELARSVHLSLPAASRLIRDLEEHGLVTRSEDPDDRRRTLVDLDPRARDGVRTWLHRRDDPLRRALSALDEPERAAFLKGMRALSDELVRESGCGSLRSQHRASHRRGPHRDRPL